MLSEQLRRRRRAATTSRSCSTQSPREDWSSMPTSLQPTAPDRGALVPVPAALPVLLEPDRDRRRAVPDELSTEDWARVFREAAELGVLQLALTGGEPLVRKDRRGARRASRPRPASTARSSPSAIAVHPEARVERCRRPASTTSRSASRTATRSSSDQIAGTKSFSKKIEAAHARAGARLPAHDQRRPPPPNLDRVERDHRARRGARRAPARAREHAVPRLGAVEPRRADADARRSSSTARRS